MNKLFDLIKQVDEIDSETEDVEHIEINEQHIDSLDTKMLCHVIILNRYLGSYKEFSKKCMEKLAINRANGDTFDFESYIDEQLKLLPKLDFDVNIFRSMI